MKEISILTWCDNNGPTNYGQILQCYAMEKICEKRGFFPKVIYFREKQQGDFLKHEFTLSFLNRWYELLYKVCRIEKHWDGRIRRFRKFIRRNITLSGPCYHMEQVKKCCENSEILLCGSDQIWNPLWFHPVYALCFAEKEQRKVAYAPGGIALENDFAREKYRELAGYLDGFYRISVREKRSVEILQKYVKSPVVDVLDPTFLLTQAEWDEVSAKRLIKEPYVLCYTLGSLRPHKHVLRAVLKRYGAKKVVYIPSNLDEVMNGRQSCDFMAYKTAGPSEFLSLIKYAEAVCTDSFHGMALSINYEKQFFIMSRIQKGNDVIASEERQKNVLEKCSIQSRKIKCIKDLEELADIDYKQVNRHLEKEIRRSEAFLEETLGEETEQEF